MQNLLGQRIRQARKLRNISQEKFAELCEKSVSAISRIENGETMPSLKTLLHMSQILEVGPEVLLCDFIFDDTAASSPSVAEAIKLLNTLNSSQQQFILNLIELYIQQL